MSLQTQNYFNLLGPKLFKNGYDVIPLVPNEKRPVHVDWVNRVVTSEDVGRWSEERPNAGVGLRTPQFPAIDIDVLDDLVVDEMVCAVEEMLGSSPVRTGRAPKCALV